MNYKNSKVVYMTKSEKIIENVNATVSMENMPLTDKNK